MMTQKQNEFPTIATHKITDFDPGDVNRYVEYEYDRNFMADQVEHGRLYE